MASYTVNRLLQGVLVLFLISLVCALTYQRFVLRRDTDGALTEKPGKETT